ncbi:hypothetical protein [Haladaptatus sp. W1]|uniref:hypothetical protein n=1 Tax=Haladaptatus sp. W1 TaxID=1897478 RepID=UPI001112DC76|nr:hypothetical protein [Haladaptatus sp. W1]
MWVILLPLGDVRRSMRHAHIVLTVDEETRDRIEADLTDETVDEWLLDAIERKLDRYDEYEFVDDCAI